MRTAVVIAVLLGTVAAVAQMPPEPVLVADAPDLSVRVEFPGQDRESLAVSGRSLAAGTRLVHLPAAALERVFRAGRLWDAGERRLRLRIGGHRCTLTADSRLALVDGREVLLPVKPRALDGDLWIPVTFVTDELAALTTERISWHADDLLLTVGGVRPNVESVSVRTSARATRVLLRCSEPLGWRLEHGPGDRIRLKIYDGVLDPAAVRFDGTRGLVRGVSSRPDGDDAVVEIALRPLVSRTRSHAEDDGRTIVVVLEEEATLLPDLQARGEASMGDPDQLGPSAAVDVVVIDPGHGGEDRGVTGIDGLRESETVLALARDLRDALSDAGFTVLLTRDDDRFLEPAERAERANLAGGDVFISLHADGWFDDGARGVAAWFLAAAAVDVDDDPLAFVPWDRVQRRHLARSADLAERLAARLASDADLPVRGVGQADLVWLEGVDMPAAVVEVGLLTSPDDAALLDGRDGRRRLAAALTAAVVDFAATAATEVAP